MAVMISQDKKDLIVSCKCGCDQGIHFRLEHFDDLDSMMYMSVLSGNFYTRFIPIFKDLGAVTWLRKE